MKPIRNLDVSASGGGVEVRMGMDREGNFAGELGDVGPLPERKGCRAVGVRGTAAAEKWLR